MKKNLILTFMIFATFTSLFAEDIFIQGRSSVFNAQFWERRTSSDTDTFKNQKIMTNTTGGSFGASAEWVMWDMGKTRGSRISLFGGLDVVFLGLNYMGHTDDGMAWSEMHDIDLEAGGAFYSGFKLDLYFCGTFPRTDLKWGFGFDANFMFQSYASVVKPYDDEIFSPFFTPSVLLAYDILLKKTATVIYKLTPMLKVGLTCYPMVPDYFMTNMSNYGYLKESSPENWYSGFYIELSVSTSFMSFKWKK